LSPKAERGGVPRGAKTKPFSPEGSKRHGSKKGEAKSRGFPIDENNNKIKKKNTRRCEKRKKTGEIQEGRSLESIDLKRSDRRGKKRSETRAELPADSK